MTKLSFKLTPFWALVTLFLWSCSAVKHSEQSNDAALAPFYYKTFKINSTKPLEGTDSTYFLITYPQFEDSLINDYVLYHIVLDTGKTNVEEMGKAFIDDYDDFYEKAEFKRPWYFEKQDSVQIQTENYIGFKSNMHSYTGGAHGNYYIFFTNYSLTQNRSLFLPDFIENEHYDAFEKIAENIFRKQEGLSIDHPLNEEYFFEDGIFTLPLNFILQKEGFLFLYNIYEIKPYVSGITELFIPYSAILEMLTEEGKEYIHSINNKI